MSGKIKSLREDLQKLRNYFVNLTFAIVEEKHHLGRLNLFKAFKIYFLGLK